LPNNLQATFPGIEVTARAVRYHYGVLERKHKNKMTQEGRATGIEEIERRVEGENEIKKANVEKEKNQSSGNEATGDGMIWRDKKEKWWGIWRDTRKREEKVRRFIRMVKGKSSDGESVTRSEIKGKTRS
jgi:hypothetical protein